MATKELKKRDTETAAVTAAAPENLPVYTPRVDIVETEREFRLTADMPGCDEESMAVDLEGNTLVLRGTCTLQPPAGYALTYQEYRSGNYERTFTLGSSIEREGIQATVRDGVLSLTLPKAREAQPRRIAVKAG